MDQYDPANRQHDHVFGHDRELPGERRTLVIVVITALMMVIEIVAGVVFGSMALLADGLHMASHAAALGIAVVAYVLSRRLAADSRFSFGTGKINSLAGFASALLLGGFAVVMVVESVGRFIAPIDIAYDQALIVAVVGLLVNGGSAWLLAATPHDEDEHDHDHRHDEAGHRHHHHHEHHHDHNLRAAYLHVLADALTSLLAILALLAAKYYGARWLDPMMGIVGAVLVARWSAQLLRDTARVLLDRQADEPVTRQIRTAIESGSQDRVADLHVWELGGGKRAIEMTIVSDAPQDADHYRALIPPQLRVVHMTIEPRRRGSA